MSADPQGSEHELAELADPVRLDSGVPVQQIAWLPAEDDEESNRVALMSSHSVDVFALSACETPVTRFQSSEAAAPFRALAWYPHDHSQLCAARGQDAVFLDSRTEGEGTRISDAHSGAVRSVDFNPNRPGWLLTGGDDGAARVWDARAPARPVRTLHGHGGAICGARYNRHHDQLVLLGSEDTQASLWRLPSVSAALVISDDAGDAGAVDRAPDTVLQQLDHHEDTVYAVAWSVGDPWAYATLSYDGRLVVHVVSPEEKYRILLAQDT